MAPTSEVPFRSLWLQKEGANEDDYAQLRKKIKREIGFKISFEGIYR